MQRILLVAGVALSMLVGGTAGAGVVITAESTSAGESPHPVSIMLEADRLRQSAGTFEMIYRADLKKVWMLHEADHKYREMNPETMQAMRTQMDAAMEQMKKQMESMPEAQRKQMEAMLGQHMPSAPQVPQPVSYEKAGPAKKVGGWSCTPYHAKSGGQSQDELCVAHMSDVGLKREDLKVYESLGSFMQQLMPTGQGGGRPMAIDIEGLSKAVGYDAMPIQSTQLGDDGKVEHQTTVKQVERKSIAAATFELPAGYTKQEMPMPGGRPR